MGEDGLTVNIWEIALETHAYHIDRGISDADELLATFVAFDDGELRATHAQEIGEEAQARFVRSSCHRWCGKLEFQCPTMQAGHGIARGTGLDADRQQHVGIVLPEVEHLRTPHGSRHSLLMFPRQCPQWLLCILLLFTLACSRQPPPTLFSERMAAQELTHLGQVYQAQGHQARALQAYQQAVQMHPSYIPALSALGDWYYGHQEYAQAEAAYKKILTLDPGQAEIYHNLCWVYLSTHQSLDAAESLIQQALALNPSPRHRYLDTQTVIWMRQGKYEQALASLEEAIGLTPLSAHEALAGRYQLLSEVYGHLGRDQEAQWAHEQAAMARRIGENPQEGDL